MFLGRPCVSTISKRKKKEKTSSLYFYIDLDSRVFTLLAAKGSVLLDFYFKKISVTIERETSQFLIYERPMPKKLAPSSVTEMEGFYSASELSIRSQSTTDDPNRICFFAADRGKA